MIPVILSGGSGERLWPLSRAQMPKQFQKLRTDKTMFQETLLRLNGVETSTPIIVCNEDHRFIAAENLREIGVDESRIILEPIGRNTAPAIALAAIIAQQNDNDPILLIMPADHIIKDVQVFECALKIAQKYADNGTLVTFGIVPDKPHTGYGYIECGTQQNDTYTLNAFKEKPDEATARKFMASGQYLWNSGMFMFRASAYLDALKIYEPDLLNHAHKAASSIRNDLDFIRIDEAAFEKCKDISIDYAVMERIDNGIVVPLDAGWSDIGSWDSLYETLPKDPNGNATIGDVKTVDAKNNYIHSDHKLVTALGVENLVIVDTKDALLVTTREHAQNVKTITQSLKSESRSEAVHHRTVYRPWGHYDSVSVGETDQVKRITVKAHAKLSLQKHEHRSEHWVVVKGTAKVTKGDDVIELHENESIYIPLGTKHALENPNDTPLEIIEVQTGTYLGEDDIIRFEDLYGRK